MKHVLKTFQPMGEISRNNRKQKEIKMKTNYPCAFAVNQIKLILSGLVLATGVMLTQPVLAAHLGPEPVNLRSCSNFAVLAHEATSSTGSGIINGDVGLTPGTSQGIPPPQVNGNIYVNDAAGIAAQAQLDLTTAYNDAAVRSENRITVSGDIGGQTLAPGLYTSSSTLGITGDLTLAGGADDVWIFQVGSALTTLVDSRVILTGGAQAKNIFWQVSSSATLGTYSVFKGIIMAQDSISMLNGSSTDGRSLARTGQVTFNGISGGKSSQAITNFIPTNGSVFAGTNLVGLSAQASSGLPVSFLVGSGPGHIVGTNLVFTATGLVSIVASQAGDTSYTPAPNVTNTYSVLPAAAKLGQTITNFMPANGSTFAGTNLVGLSAQASSLLPVSFTRKSGPGAITGGTNLAFASTGLASIVASQTGNMFYAAAPNVTNTFTIIPPLPTGLGWVEIQVTPSSGSWRLTVPAGYTGPSSGTGNLAPVSAVLGEYIITYGALSGYLAPTNNNQSQVVIGGVTSLFAGVYRQVSTSITPPVVTATEGTYTDKIQISWPSVPGVSGYEIWKSQSNDVNTAVLIADVPDNGSATFQSDDYDVVPGISYYYWGLAKTATEVSLMSLVSMGYASLAPDPNAPRADITASDMVYLPVNVTNLTTAGTVSFWLGNLGPATLNSNEVAFAFRIGSDDAAMVLLGTDQRAFSLAAGEEQLVILTAQAKRGLVVPATLSGVKQVQVTVRHVSALIDPNLANNKTTAAGEVLVRASGVNSPARSVNDYDGDGKADGAIYRDSDGKWDTVLSGARYHAWLTVVAGLADLTPVPGDYDADGITDLAVYNSLNSWWTVLLSSTDQIISGPLGGPDFVAAQCDFDGDAMTDPVVYREADGTCYGAASSEGYAIVAGFFGGIGYQPVFADYDGDGLADPAVYNRTTGLWCVAFSGSGYQLLTGTFGGVSYMPVSADYNGDGLVDPAIYAPDTAYWQVLLSGPGGYTWCGDFAGSIDGVPVPADYDGDGKTDLAVYHQDTGIWELYLSSLNYQELTGGFGGPEYQAVTE